MASLAKREGKSGPIYDLWFSGGGPDGSRSKVTLGSMPKKDAIAIKTRVEYLIAASHSGQPYDRMTAEWLLTIDDKLHRKLARAGLVESRDSSEKQTIALSLGKFVDHYIAMRRPNLKPNTIRNLEQAKIKLSEFFGADCEIGSVTAGRAREWQESMLSELAEASVATHIGKAKMIFAHALDSGIIEVDPFLKIKKGSQRNSDRRFYVDGPTIEDVLAACPDNEWRIIVCLARFGGLRIPSELSELRWKDIDVEGGRILIHVKKKEHLGGHHRTREIPITEEIWKYLEEPYLARQAAASATGEDFVVSRGRQANTNLRTQLLRILKKAGFEPWPKLFQNLRVSARKDLLEQGYSREAVNAWMGHSDRVADGHYGLGATPDDFRRASAKMLQKVLHSAAIMADQEQSAVNRKAVSLLLTRETAQKVPSTGIEQT